MEVEKLEVDKSHSPLLWSEDEQIKLCCAKHEICWYI